MFGRKDGKSKQKGKKKTVMVVLGLPVLEHVANVASNYNIDWKNCEAKACKENSYCACGPVKVIRGDDARF